MLSMRVYRCACPTCVFETTVHRLPQPPSELFQYRPKFRSLRSPPSGIKHSRTKYQNTHLLPLQPCTLRFPFVSPDLKAPNQTSFFDSFFRYVHTRPCGAETQQMNGGKWRGMSGLRFDVLGCGGGSRNVMDEGRRF